MRIMIYTGDLNKKTEDLAKKFKKELFGTVDIFNDLEEATYCMEIRNYDLALIEFKNDNYKEYYELFKAAKNKSENEISPKMIVFGEKMEDFIKEKYSYYKLQNIKIGDENLYEDSLDLLLGEDSINEIVRDNLIANVKSKEIFLKNNKGELTKVVLKKKIDFFVLLYFLRHYKEVINLSCILDATFEEPELTKDSIIEASISSIRKTFQNTSGHNPIKAFKKIGYQFSLTN